MNAHDQSYINVGADELLQTTISDNIGGTEFLKREQVVERISEKMQNWYEIRAEGNDPVLKCGPSLVMLCWFLTSRRAGRGS